MKYSEIFYTLQGEGKLIGVPSVFFRTSYCNLRCAWCDTPYTSWFPEDKEISVARAFDKITQFGIKHVVITGGEPFLQAKELAQLCELLFAEGHYITVETNATLFTPIKAHLISMSPKLSHSTPAKDVQLQTRHERDRLKPEIMRSFLNHYDCQVKFVIQHSHDIQEVQNLVEQVLIPKDAVVLMPQGIDEHEVNARQKWLVELCKETGYRYSPRLHLNIWGNQRGT